MRGIKRAIRLPSVSVAGAGGDVDTTGAIVGGIVGAFVGRAGIPPDRLASREPLPDWLP